jgi:hypothetical protein
MKKAPEHRDDEPIFASVLIMLVWAAILIAQEIWTNW